MQLLFLVCVWYNEIFRKYIIGPKDSCSSSRSDFMSCQVMRKHVMVRVGGGWDTLERYFEKHDPCKITGRVIKKILLSKYCYNIAESLNLSDCYQDFPDYFYSATILWDILDTWIIDEDPMVPFKDEEGRNIFRKYGSALILLSRNLSDTVIRYWRNFDFNFWRIFFKTSLLKGTYQAIISVKSRGSQCFICFPSLGRINCPNCVENR